jgi:prepilin-type N-terminal cleavage/methylation domain-containing protein
MFTTPRTARRRPSAYTLIELLIVITILGIAGMMVIPSFASTDVLRVQGAIRTIVSDVGVAQSDAIALQKGRAIVFHPDAANPYYAIVEVNGSNVDEALDTLERRELGGSVFGHTSILAVNLPNNMIVFDELGGPVTAPGSGVPANDGYVDIAGSGQRFRIHLEGYTGRVTVERLADSGGP